MEGVELILFHPFVAFRDCEHCQQYLYWEDGEEIGQPVKRGDNLVKRNIGSLPPCRTPKGCPKGSPEEPKTLTEKNQAAYQHYRECRATGQFPDDAIVRQNATTIRQLEDARERRDQAEFQSSLLSMMAAR